MPKLNKADPNAIAQYRSRPATGYAGPTRMCQACKEFRPMKGGTVTGERYRDGLGGGLIKGGKTRFVCARCLRSNAELSGATLAERPTRTPG